MGLQTFANGVVLYGPVTGGQVSLTGLQANDYNWTVSEKTASYVLVAADVGTRISMTVATANTITVNTSLFAAGDVVAVRNLGAGATTITSGTCTVSSAGSLVVNQYGGGQLVFTTASTALWFPSAGSAGGLVYLGGATFTTAATVSTAALFTATYKNYLVKYTVTAASTDSTAINVRLRVGGVDDSSASYNTSGVTYLIGTATIGASNTGTTAWQFGQFNGSDRNKVELEIDSPQVAADTHLFYKFYGRVSGSQGGGNGAAEFRGATQFTAITLFPTAGTITGSYEVYGYALS